MGNGDQIIHNEEFDQSKIQLVLSRFLLSREDYSKNRLSLEAGLNRNTVGQILSNTQRAPRLVTLESLAGAMNIEVCDFFRPPELGDDRMTFEPVAGLNGRVSAVISSYLSQFGETANSLSVRAGLNRNFIQQLASGKAESLRADTAVFLASAMGVRLSCFFSDQPYSRRSIGCPSIICEKKEWDREIGRAIRTMRSTSKASMKTRISESRKTKKILIPEELQYAILERVLSEQDYKCAITGIPISDDNNAEDFRLSLDRIDSSGHYEVGNIQFVCRCVNMWKGARDDIEFRQILSKVVQAMTINK